MKTSTSVMTASAAVLACACLAAHAADGRGKLTRVGWFAGLPVTMHVQLPARQGGPAPNSATDKYPDVIVYVTAPTRANGEGLPQMSVQTAQGLRVLPAHDDVVTRMPPRTAPADAIGYFVVPGPKADESNVRSQPNPQNGWPGAPLAREIFVGADWVKLTNHAVIEYGLAMQWLSLEYFDYGGLMSTTLFDPDVRLDVRIETQPHIAYPAQAEE